MAKSSIFLIGVTLLFLAISSSILPRKNGTAISVMTFNIRYDNQNDKPNDWPNRRDWVGELVEFYKPDFVGTQEALYHQLTDMQDRMPNFAFFGGGRDDGEKAGEHSAIFYRKDKYELMRSSTFWLSETPEVAGVKGWDAAFPRVITWGEFKDKKTGKRFFVFNTHFDHMGVEAREESAKMMVRKVSEIAGVQNTIVMGDFNADPKSNVYEILTKGASGAKGMLDVYILAEKPYGPEWTFHGFGNMPMNERKRIDYILVNGKAKVNRYVSIAEQRGDVFPSDHLPVMAEIVFGE